MQLLLASFTHHLLRPYICFQFYPLIANLGAFLSGQESLYCSSWMSRSVLYYAQLPLGHSLCCAEPK